MIKNQEIEEFLKDLSNSTPTPGGGAASALVGSIGASLSAMVANLTVGKKKYTEVEQEMKEIATKAETLKQELLTLMDKDVMAFNKIMEAYKLPKESEKEKIERSKKLEEASIEACNVPLLTANACLEVMKLAETVVKKGNKNAVSDGMCSAYFSHAAIRGALLNIRINLANIRNAEKLKNFNDLVVDIMDRSDKFLEETVIISEEVLK